MKKILLISLLSLVFMCFTSCHKAEKNSILDYSAFLDLLNSAGFSYEVEEKDHGFLSVNPIPIIIGEDTISVYEYETNDLMEKDSSYISYNGNSINYPDTNNPTGCLSVMISWVSHPHFFKKDLLIINYVGENEDILNFLENHFGNQFAGS